MDNYQLTGPTHNQHTKLPAATSAPDEMYKRLASAIRSLQTYTDRARLIGFGSLVGKLLRDLRTSTAYGVIGRASDLVRVRFDQAKKIPGAFNLDDMHQFLLLLRMQTRHGVRGDVLEIGSYHGRSTSLISLALAEAETLVVCDAFEADTDDHYRNRPSPERLITNIRAVHPEIEAERVEIHAIPSDSLEFAPDRRFRFVHIDGGHEADQAQRDLELADRYLLPEGLIAIDDYDHPAWPGVRQGVDRFLKDHPEYDIVLDANRHGAYGRKLFIGPRTGAADARAHPSP